MPAKKASKKKGMSVMDMGAVALELSCNRDAYFMKIDNVEPPTVSAYTNCVRVLKPDFNISVLTREQIRRINSRYQLADLTREEEESLVQELIKLDILTVDDGCSYIKSGGNVLESLTKQIGANINLLYQMAVKGRYSNPHIEIIKSQQKILNVMEQLLAELD